MKKGAVAFILLFITVFLSAQTKNVKSAISSIDTADLSILNVYPNTFPDVSVIFRAEKRDSEPVWNLTREKMKVTENGNACPVISLNQLSKNKPIVLGVVFDHSFSMSTGGSGESPVINTNVKAESPIDSAKKAIKNFTKSFNTHKDLIGIIGFSDTVDVKLSPGQDVKAIASIIDSLNPTSSTALYDAMITGIDEIKNSEGIKVLVVLTDGQDNRSKFQLKDVVNHAVKEHTPIYIVGLGNVNKDSLQLIASKTNGKCYFTESSSSLDRIYSDISKQVQAFYELVYNSEIFSAKDTLRDIQLTFDIDSIFLVSNQSSFSLPEEVKQVLAKKDLQREYIFAGGIFIVSLITVGMLVLRFTKNKKEVRNYTPVINNVFPSPSNGPLTISIEGKATYLKIFTITGQLSRTYSIAGNSIHFDFSSLRKGAYIAIAYYGAAQSNPVQFTLE